jgi:hypothetical protein
MKLRWHFLFLIISGAIAGYLLFSWQKPLWEIPAPRHVSFANADPVKKEWHCIVQDEKQEYWYETRAGRDPKVIRRQQLLFPASTRILPTRMNTDGSIVVDEHRLAMVDRTNVVLYDLHTNISRVIPVGEQPFLSFSPDGKLLACLSPPDSKLRFIDWATEQLIDAFQEDKPVKRFQFIGNNTLLVGTVLGSSEAKFRRYHGDGVALQPITPGIKLQTRNRLPLAKTSKSGELHIAFGETECWPTEIKLFCEWLEGMNIPVPLWYPKRFHVHWCVLNEKDQIIREYDEKTKHLQQELYDHAVVSMTFFTQENSDIMRLWNHAPRWPNALAAGMLVYLAGYVAMRCWRNNYPPLMT